jgi:hypothetical protein
LINHGRQKAAAYLGVLTYPRKKVQSTDIKPLQRVVQDVLCKMIMAPTALYAALFGAKDGAAPETGRTASVYGRFAMLR